MKQIGVNRSSFQNYSFHKGLEIVFPYNLMSVIILLSKTSCVKFIKSLGAWIVTTIFECQDLLHSSLLCKCSLLRFSCLTQKHAQWLYCSRVCNNFFGFCRRIYDIFLSFLSLFHFFCTQQCTSYF